MSFSATPIVRFDLLSSGFTQYKWVIDLTNVGVSSVVIDNKDNWIGHINGSVINISAKPASDAVDRKDQDGGVLPTFKITNSDGWKLTGTFLDNRYREAFYVEHCDYFELGCSNLGSGINDNLTANHFRYCNHFKLSGVRLKNQASSRLLDIMTGFRPPDFGIVAVLL